MFKRRTDWNRFDDASYIVDGACNPSGIANSIIECCEDVRNEGAALSHDAALKLMVFQLAHVVGVNVHMDLEEFSRLLQECRLRRNS